MTPIKLNLGSGGTNWPGYINVDLANNWSGVPPDVIAPLTDLPFDDGYADEAHLTLGCAPNFCPLQLLGCKRK